MYIRKEKENRLPKKPQILNDVIIASIFFFYFVRHNTFFLSRQINLVNFNEITKKVKFIIKIPIIKKTEFKLYLFLSFSL